MDCVESDVKKSKLRLGNPAEDGTLGQSRAKATALEA
jgi:hypothetical protein